MQLQAMEVTLPDLTISEESALLVTLPAARCIEPIMEKLQFTLRNHPGKAEVHLKITSPGRATLLRCDERFRVEKGPALYGDLKALLGANCLV
jgi:DNA polymerase-3 subunit alpha